MFTSLSNSRWIRFNRRRHRYYQQVDILWIQAAPTFPRNLEVLPSAFVCMRRKWWRHVGRIWVWIYQLDCNCIEKLFCKRSLRNSECWNESIEISFAFNFPLHQQVLNCEQKLKEFSRWSLNNEFDYIDAWKSSWADWLRIWNSIKYRFRRVLICNILEKISEKL